MTDKPMSLTDLFTPAPTEIHEDLRSVAELWAAYRQDIEEVAEVARRFGRVDQDTAARIVTVLDDRGFTLDAGPLRQIADIVGGVHVLTMAVDGGWLPHYTSPRIIWDGPLEAASVSRAYEAHYQEHWPEVKKQFRQFVSDLDIDDEAKATFEEALSAHEQGFYRSTARLIFPELERIARVELADDNLKVRLASQPQLQEMVSSLSSAGMLPGGLPIGAFADQLTRHIFKKADTEEARARLQASAIPNRHAALHGVVPYASHQSSINALIIADFSFQVITAVKRTTSAP